MSKLKHYIDANVYEEAKKRIKHIIATFDTVNVCFSGGKDSLVMLHLTEEVYEELGLTEKINVIFRDEELIPDDVIEFVQAYYHSGKYNFRYFAAPLKSNKFILGNSFQYIQWDPEREWIRPKPDFAIEGEEGVLYDQYTMDAFTVQGQRGKIALLTGIRADESLTRLRAAVNKKNENYINATESPNIKICKPIFDWSEKDIFKYLYEKNIPYCPIYDKQMFNGDSLRVSTPLHAEAAKRLGKLRTVYPQFYQQIVNIFPEVLVQDLYWNSFDRYGIIEKYEHSWLGILKYINDNIKEPERAALAKTRLFHAKQFRESAIKKNAAAKKNLGGYPILYVFKCIINGDYKRKIQPKDKISESEREYEK